MGLGFKSLAQTGATPFWQTVATSGNWDQQEMGFYMRRYRGTSGVSQVENEGGTFTMGYVSNSCAHTCVLGAIPGTRGTSQGAVPNDRTSRRPEKVVG